MGKRTELEGKGGASPGGGEREEGKGEGGKGKEERGRKGGERKLVGTIINRNYFLRSPSHPFHFSIIGGIEL